jgi:hypothetical protein
VNDIERLEERCYALEKECATLREVLASLIKKCPLDHSPRKFTYRPWPCPWCGDDRQPDPEYVKKIDSMTAARKKNK